ncbi:Hypothetical_protein [Hexamita inflata]|uniref:Hypothetical_protein n=1 Tax=Hexamita inflata TaxID=28002 RepID=A0AA86PUK0_9EUKA|nr:Hypothetical protein HINF_LOCUS34235 [Hexamita inflata]
MSPNTLQTQARSSFRVQAQSCIIWYLSLFGDILKKQLYQVIASQESNLFLGIHPLRKDAICEYQQVTRPALLRSICNAQPLKYQNTNVLRDMHLHQSLQTYLV